MLVLSRKKNESIVIGEIVQVVVIEVRGDKVRLGIEAPKEDKVRLGIEAPKEVVVHRKEVWEAIQRQAKAAGESAPASS